MHDNKPNNFYIKHFFIIFQIKKLQRLFDTFVPLGIYSVETTNGINSVISKLMTFVENAEAGQFLFLIVLILSCFTCS
jgi:hypothetical protein